MVNTTRRGLWAWALLLMVLQTSMAWSAVEWPCDPTWDVDCEEEEGSVIKSDSADVQTDRDGTAGKPAASGVYPAYDGPRQTIAVLNFENKTRYNPESYRIGEGMTEMLITELAKTNRFRLVERAAVKQILTEQELGQTGLVRPESAVRTGGLAGAQFLVKGAVTEFQYTQEGSGVGLQFKSFDLGTKSSKAHVGIDVRIIDSATGQITTSYHAKAKADASEFKIGYSKDDLRVGTANFERTPLGQATRQAIREAVRFIIEQGKAIGWSGSIIKVMGNTAYVNRGNDAGIRQGQSLRVFSRSENLIDPETGLNLGAEEMYIGTLTITNVQEKFSSGQLQIHGVTLPKRGDVVRLNQ